MHDTFLQYLHRFDALIQEHNCAALLITQASEFRRAYTEDLLAFLALPMVDVPKMLVYNGVNTTRFDNTKVFLDMWVNPTRVRACRDNVNQLNQIAYIMTGKKVVTLRLDRDRRVTERKVLFLEGIPPENWDIMNPETDLAELSIEQYELMFKHAPFKLYRWYDTNVIRGRIHRLYADIPTEYPDFVNIVLGQVIALARHIQAIGTPSYSYYSNVGQIYLYVLGYTDFCIVCD